MKHAPKESADTIEDIIEFVRTEMYKEMHVNPTENDSDSDKDMDIFKTNDSNNLNENMEKESNEKENGGDASVSDREDNGESEGIVPSDTIINHNIEIPSDWFFPSFFLLLFLVHSSKTKRD